MPTILRVGPYRFFFYSGDKDEPIHVHIEHDDKIAKVWIEPIRLHYSGGFSRTEIARIIRIIITYKEQILEAWNDYFDN